MSTEPEYVEDVQEQPDRWHAHTSAEGTPQSEHGARANPLFLGSILGSMVVFTGVLSILVIIYFNSYVTKIKALKMETTWEYSTFAAFKAESLGAGGRLNTSGIVDTNEQIVHIPIEIAMDKVVAEYGGNN